MIGGVNIWKTMIMYYLICAAHERPVTNTDTRMYITCLHVALQIHVEILSSQT